MENRGAGIFHVFKNRNYAKLFWAGFASQTGSVIGMVALTFYFLEHFGSQPFYATLTEMMYSLPTLLVFFLVGVLADRIDRQKITIYSDWIRAGLSLLLLAAIVWMSWMPLVFAILFLRSAVSKFFAPAQAGLIQGILKEDQYTMGAGLNQMTSSLFILFGNGLGAFCYWYFGIAGAILIDTLSFVISALLLHACAFDESVRLPNGKMKVQSLQFKTIFGDLKEGIFYILQYRLLLVLLTGAFMLGIVNGGLTVMPIFMMKYKLAPQTYEEMTIWIGIIFGIGVLIGSVIASLLLKKLHPYQMIIAGFFLSGIFLAAEALAPTPLFFFALYFFVSLSFPFVNVAFFGWFPAIVNPNMMGRVQGWLDPLSMLSQSLALGLIAMVFPSAVKIETLFYVIGLSVLFIGGFFLLTLPSLVKKSYGQSQQNIS